MVHYFTYFNIIFSRRGYDRGQRGLPFLMTQLRFPEWAHQELRKRPDYPDLMKDAKALLVTLGQFPADPWQAMDEMETASLMAIAAMEPEHHHLLVLLQIQNGILRAQRHRIGG